MLAPVTSGAASGVMSTRATCCGLMRTVAQPVFPFTIAPTRSSPGAYTVTSPVSSAAPTSKGAANHAVGLPSIRLPSASRATAEKRRVCPTSASADAGDTCTRSAFTAGGEAGCPNAGPTSVATVNRMAGKRCMRAPGTRSSRWLGRGASAPAYTQYEALRGDRRRLPRAFECYAGRSGGNLGDPRAAVPSQQPAGDQARRPGPELQVIDRHRVELRIGDPIGRVLDRLDDGRCVEQMVLIVGREVGRGRHGAQVVSHVIPVPIRQPDIVARILVAAVAVDHVGGPV